MTNLRQRTMFAPLGYTQCLACGTLRPATDLHCASRRCTQLRANAHLKALKRAFEKGHRP